ncbi:MAG: hypothetical protein H7X94_00290 [Vallitaleaceae bacterium]|nr:hypothetical protein [Vallitaleaceae bacterium]
MKDTEGQIKIIVEDFLLQHVLECGQCFRFSSEGDSYRLVAKSKVLKVRQIGKELTLFCSVQEYQQIWMTYFDLERDYGEIKRLLGQKDPHLKKAVEEKHGIRILRQEPWEMLISFIISQTKQIPHIKKIIEDLSNCYGTLIHESDGQAFYAFPTPQQLRSATEDDLRALKVGFRAPYIWNATYQIAHGKIQLEALEQMPYLEAKEILMSLNGVGSKVADCVLLFAYGKYEVFPTDVWVKRVVEHYYFKDEQIKMTGIQTFAKESFGDLAGFAQQYLFYHARDNKIGK